MEKCSVKAMQEYAEVNVPSKRKRNFGGTLLPFQGTLSLHSNLFIGTLNTRQSWGALLRRSEFLTPSLEIFQNCLDTTLRQVLQEKLCLSLGRCRPFQPHPSCDSLQVPALGFPGLTPFPRKEQLIPFDDSLGTLQSPPV